MPMGRPPPDPFTATSNAASSQPGLRSNASAAPARTRHQGSLFAPALSRRPNSRTTPRVEDEVLADSDEENDTVGHGHIPRQRHTRLRPRQQEEREIVNRQPDGSYLLGGPAFGIPSAQSTSIFDPQQQGNEQSQDELDSFHAAMAKKHFTSGAHITTGKHTKQVDDEFERERPEMTAVLREQVMRKLEDERWLYEAGDRFQPGV